MFIDASALVAVLGREEGWEQLALRLQQANAKFISPISMWEATRGLHKSFDISLEGAEALVRNLVQVSRVEIIAIDDEVGREANRASRVFGKGRHRAALNMGDCFAYACAKLLDVPLLFKGEDFARTDIRSA